MPALPRVDRLKPIYSAAKALNDGYKVYAVPKGIGSVRSIPSPVRITLRFDPLSTSSSGARSFIKNEINVLSNSLSSIAFYTQPVRQERSQIVAEYSNGREIRVNIDGESSQSVYRFLCHVISRNGDGILNLTCKQSSKVPSIQGEWIPSFRHKHDLNNIPTATEYFLLNQKN